MQNILDETFPRLIDVFKVFINSLFFKLLASAILDLYIK